MIKKKILITGVLTAAALALFSGCSGKNQEAAVPPESHGEEIHQEDHEHEAPPEEQGLSEEEKKLAAQIDAEIAAYDLTVPEDFGTVDLCDYSNIDISGFVPSEVTDDLIAEYVKSRMLDKRAEESAEGIEMGDAVIGNFVSRELGGSEDERIRIGDGTYGEAVDEALLGHRAGETVDIEYTFPDDYRTKELAGTDTIMHVTVKSVLKTPELSDEIAKDEGYSNMEELLSAVRKELADGAVVFDRMVTMQMAYESMLKYTGITVSEEAKEWLLNYTLNRNLELCRESGYSFGESLMENGTTLEAEREIILEDSEEFLECSAFNKAVAKKEGIIPTDEDMEECLEMYGYENFETAEAECGKDIVDLYVLDTAVKKFLVSRAEQDS